MLYWHKIANYNNIFANIITNNYFLLIECPEPVHDNKTLYERLEEQKQKKQDEWDEQHQLSKFTVFLSMFSVFCSNLILVETI